MSITSATMLSHAGLLYTMIKPDQCFNGNRRKMHFRLEINWRHVIYGNGFVTFWPIISFQGWY